MFSAISVSLVFFFIFVLNVSAQTYICSGKCGDVNQDNQVDGLDKLRLQEYVTGTATINNTPCSDVNSDFFINIADVSLMANYLNGQANLNCIIRTQSCQTTVINQRTILNQTTVINQTNVTYSNYSNSGICDRHFWQYKIYENCETREPKTVFVKSPQIEERKVFIEVSDCTEISTQSNNSIMNDQKAIMTKSKSYFDLYAVLSIGSLLLLLAWFGGMKYARKRKKRKSKKLPKNSSNE